LFVVSCPAKLNENSIDAASPSVSSSVVVMNGDERAGQIVARPSLCRRPARAGSDGTHHRRGHLDLLLRSRLAPAEGSTGTAPLLHLLPVALGKAHETEDRDGGQREREGINGIERVRVIDGVEQVDRQAADHRFHLGHALRGEGLHCRGTQAFVGRLVEADHRRLRLVTAVEKDLADVITDRNERQLGGGGRERVGVHEDRLDVVVASDDVVVDARSEEHRRALRQSGQHAIGIDLVFGREGIEVGLHRAASGQRRHASDC
jgi:hypothetical protein